MNERLVIDKCVPLDDRKSYGQARRTKIANNGTQPK